MFEEKKRLLEAAKADMALGYKHREASISKWILGICLLLFMLPFFLIVNFVYLFMRGVKKKIKLGFWCL